MALWQIQRHGEDAQEVGSQALPGAVHGAQRVVDADRPVGDQVRRIGGAGLRDMGEGGAVVVEGPEEQALA